MFTFKDVSARLTERKFIRFLGRKKTCVPLRVQVIGICSEVPSVLSSSVVPLDRLPLLPEVITHSLCEAGRLLPVWTLNEH